MSCRELVAHWALASAARGASRRNAALGARIVLASTSFMTCAGVAVSPVSRYGSAPTSNWYSTTPSD
jgi:hypothetical protein